MKLNKTLIAVSMADRHNTPPFPVGTLKISGAVHPKEYRRDYGAYAVVLICIVMVGAVVAALVTL